MTDLLDELGFESFQLDEEERNYLEALIQREVIAMLTEAVRKAERDGPPPPWKSSAANSLPRRAAACSNASLGRLTQLSQLDEIK
jgi:hypothetical protein